MPVKAIIDVFWNEPKHSWEGYAEFQIGHVCDCHHCGRTGLKMQGIVAAAHSEQQAFQLACQNVQKFLSSVHGVPMSIITQPGTTEVEFAEDHVAMAERAGPYSGRSNRQYDDEYEEDEEG